MYDFLLSSVEEHYEVVKELKSGPRGSVRLLRHKETGKRFIFRTYQGNAEVYRKLLEITSPHLPEILEVGEKDGNVAVLEEYIQGDTLAALLKADVFSQKEARRLGRQICAGLWALHTLGAVHRDVKPENVILRENQAVLIDFDASRLVKEQNTTDTLVLGTTGYAAPEQYGIAQSDRRTDIYAMGVLLNILCTGRHPSEVPAKGHLGRVIRKCTMMSPDNRYQDVLSLMEAL